MKKWIRRAGALLVAVTLALPALAANNVINMGTYYINPKTGQVVDANGNVKSLEVLKDRDYTVSGDLINSNIAVSSADSSGVVPIGDIRRLSFFIRPTAVGAKRIRLAIQIRLHKAAAADSTSMFVWSPDMCFSQNFRLNAQGVADSVGDVGTLPTVYESAQPGEFMVTWDVVRNAPVAATFGQYPNAKCLNIECLGGAKWFSIRVRNCSANATVPVVISYTGSPL